MAAIEKRRKNMAEQLFKVSEVAQILRCDKTTVRRWITIGAMEAVILPHASERQAYRIKRSTLDRVLLPLEQGGTQ